MNFYFQKRDQATIAILLSFGVLLIFWKYSPFFRSSEFIDIETDAKREYQFTIDINSAEWPEIALVPGIGQELAMRIENYRARNGGYSSLEQLGNVDGIGPGKLKALRKYLLPIPSQKSIKKEPVAKISSSKDGV